MRAGIHQLPPLRSHAGPDLLDASSAVALVAATFEKLELTNPSLAGKGERNEQSMFPPTHTASSVMLEASHGVEQRSSHA